MRNDSDAPSYFGPHIPTPSSTPLSFFSSPKILRFMNMNQSLLNLAPRGQWELGSELHATWEQLFGLALIQIPIQGFKPKTAYLLSVRVTALTFNLSVAPKKKFGASLPDSFGALHQNAKKCPQVVIGSVSPPEQKTCRQCVILSNENTEAENIHRCF